MIDDWTGRIVGVIGAGRSGQAAARLIVRMGGRPRVSEGGGEDRIPEDFRRWAAAEGVPWEAGGHTAGFLDPCEALVISPGVRRDAPPCRWARDRGVPIFAEVEWAFRFCRGEVVAVTGSNGKTTVATLIREILASAGRPACLCGNSGFPFSAAVEEGAAGVYVVEVSSFQLEAVETFHPRVAVFLNLSRNHLDRHRDMAEYGQLKTRIFRRQGPDDYAVLNADDPWVAALAPRLKAEVRWFGRSRSEPEAAEWEDRPDHQAAAVAAGALGVGPDVCRRAFRGFRGVEHRLERVRLLDGVTYVNDSKATTTEAMRWALERTEGCVILICGGRDKGADFAAASDAVRGKVREAFVIGEAREAIREAFRGVTTVTAVCDLAEAVARARAAARPGDTVLLSPMCASFDMFTDFEHRGRVFKEIVARLR